MQIHQQSIILRVHAYLESLITIQSAVSVITERCFSQHIIICQSIKP